MSKRTVQIRTVTDRMSAALLELERAATSALRCSHVTVSMHQEIVRVFRDVARVRENISSRKRPPRQRHG